MRGPKLLLPQGLSTHRLVRTVVKEVRSRVVRAWKRGEFIHHKPSDIDPIHNTYLWVSEGVFPASSSRRSLVAEKNCGLRVLRTRSGKALSGLSIGPLPP